MSNDNTAIGQIAPNTKQASARVGSIYPVLVKAKNKISMQLVVAKVRLAQLGSTCF